MAKRKGAISKKRQRLEALLERLEKDDEVSLRDFKNAISNEEYQDYEHVLEQQRVLLSVSISGSAEYDRLLKKGILFYNRGESARKKGRRICRKHFGEAKILFEQALERLREDVGRDPSIAAAYDRSIDECVGSDPSGMPRLRTSKSADNEARESRCLDKRKCKIRIIKEAIVKEKEEEGRAALEKNVSEDKVGRSKRKRKKDVYDLMEERLAQANENRKVQKVGRKKVSKGGEKDRGLVSSGSVKKSAQKSTVARQDKLADLLKKLRKGHKGQNRQ